MTKVYPWQVQDILAPLPMRANLEGPSEISRPLSVFRFFCFRSLRHIFDFLLNRPPRKSYLEAAHKLLIELFNASYFHLFRKCLMAATWLAIQPREQSRAPERSFHLTKMSLIIYPSELSSPGGIASPFHRFRTTYMAMTQFHTNIRGHMSRARSVSQDKNDCRYNMLHQVNFCCSIHLKGLDF